MPTEKLREPLERLVAASDADGVVELLRSAFAARTITLHRTCRDSGTLEQLAAVGLPPQVAAMTQSIPFGKGMAGICYERGEPVTVCNLQTDTSGVARPAAQQTQVAGALVVPIRLTGTGNILGTLGIGKPEDHDYTDTEIAEAEEIATLLAPLL